MGAGASASASRGQDLEAYVMWRLGGWQAAWAGNRARRDIPGLPATTVFREAAAFRIGAADRAAVARTAAATAAAAVTAAGPEPAEPTGIKPPPAAESEPPVPGVVARVAAAMAAACDPEPRKRRGARNLVRALAGAAIASAALALVAVGIKAALPRVGKKMASAARRRKGGMTAAALPLGGPPAAPTMQPVGILGPLWPLPRPAADLLLGPLGQLGPLATPPLLPTYGVLALAYHAMRMGLPASCLL